MAWVVAIPSFDRLGSIKSRTLQVLLSSGISATRIYVFADPTQYTQYLKDLQSLGIHVIKGERGVCNQRNAIMRHFKPGDRIVEMDDDIKGLVTTTGAVRSDKSAKTVNVPNENLELILDHLWEIADREKCQLWGLYPVSNPWMLSRTYALGLAKSTAQLQGYYNPKDFHLTVPVMEDYERILHFYSQGNSCMRCDFLAVKTDNRGKGGLDSALTECHVQKEKDRKVMHHPREVQEAAAVKELQRRFPASVANVSGPKPVQKKVPVHGKVLYYPCGWRLMFKGRKRFISALDVSGRFAELLGLGAGVEATEAVANGGVIDLRREKDKEKKREEASEESSDSLVDELILRNLDTSDLKDLCREAGLAAGGARAQLIARLLGSSEPRADKEPKASRRAEHEESLEELQRLEAIFAQAELEETQRRQAEAEAARAAQEAARAAQEEERRLKELQERQEEERRAASVAMRALIQAEQAREQQQRRLGHQAAQILESLRAPPPAATAGAMKAVSAPSAASEGPGLAQPTLPVVRVWQPRQNAALRHLMPLHRTDVPRQLHPWPGELSARLAAEAPAAAPAVPAAPAAPAASAAPAAPAASAASPAPVARAHDGQDRAVPGERRPERTDGLQVGAETPAARKPRESADARAPPSEPSSPTEPPSGAATPPAPPPKRQKLARPPV